MLKFYIPLSEWDNELAQDCILFLFFGEIGKAEIEIFNYDISFIIDVSQQATQKQFHI